MENKDQSGIGQFTDFCVYDKNGPGKKKSQKPSFEVNFSLVTVASYLTLTFNYNFYRRYGLEQANHSCLP